MIVLEMLLFWLVYGLWMVFTWSGVGLLFLIIGNSIIKWITGNDYNLESYTESIMEKLRYSTVNQTILALGSTVFIVELILMLVLYVSPNIQHLYSFHEFAVIISEWVVTTLSTPLLFTLVVVGLLFLAKKLYPFFKKVKLAVDKLDNNK